MTHGHLGRNISIFKRGIIFRKLKKATNLNVKSNLLAKYKNYRNRIVLLTRLSKKNYYSTFFNTNMGNIRKSWEGIFFIFFIGGYPEQGYECHLSAKG